MTDEQLEVAARKLCEIRGWKTDSFDHLESVYANPLDTALDHCKREVINFYQIAQAIDSALGGAQFP